MKTTTYEWQGHPVAFQPGEHLMVNATQMAKPFGKKTNDFMRLSQTQAFIDALNQYGNSRSGQNDTEKADFAVKVVNGGDRPGTWMHRKLALKFAAWLSPEFELWVYDRIEEILTGRGFAAAPQLPTPPAAPAGYTDARHIPHGLVWLNGKPVRHIVLQDRDWYCIFDIHRALGTSTEPAQAARKLNASRTLACKVWLFGANHPTWMTTPTGLDLLLSGSRHAAAAAMLELMPAPAAGQEGGNAK